MLIALTISPQQLLLVVGLYLLIQQIENNFLGSWIMGRQVELPPLLVIIALLAGALLAVPAAAIAQALWLEVIVPWIRGVERYWDVA